ncbi:hypothetical protein CFC21_000812 [Triticum aestivum]|uniref:BTB domain-containing protein n=2 Tax=Triticum aestivum TaxID=4565 RepID=A0A3B5XVB8_WHEAT|nr:hypothetical protein CFC21_000812 [Triticum aestivum]
MSALVSALRAAGRHHLSAGTLITRPVTGSYLFRIDQYKCIQKMVGNGTVIKSATFGAGGHDWRIKCYPRGEVGYRGYISLYLEHASHGRTGDATADYCMSILDHAGNPSWTKGNAQLSDETDSESESETETQANNFSNHDAFGWGAFMKIEDLDEEEHLKDGCLCILCDVTVLDMRTTDYGARRASTGAMVPPPGLHRQLTEDLWESKEGADVEIEVGGETFPAHRWMLAAVSPIFMAELLRSPAATRIRVDGIDAGVFKALLHFIYTDALPEEMAKQEALATMAKPLLVAADRYKLDRLKLVCEEALCGHINMFSVGATLAFAEQHCCRVLKEACMHFLTDPCNLEAAVATRGFDQLKAASCHPTLRHRLEWG